MRKKVMWLPVIVLLVFLAGCSRPQAEKRLPA